MAHWQRRARLGFAIVAIGVAVLVFRTVERRPVSEAPAPLPRLDPKATIETRGGDVLQLEGTRRDVRVEFDGQVTYEDGQSKLLGVKVSVENRGGRSFVITAREGRLGKDQSAIDFSGDVLLSASDGFLARAEQARYLETEGIVRAPGPVSFERGRMSGSGVGFTYDRQRETLWLLDKAVVQFGAERSNPTTHVVAGAAGFARAEHYLRFEREMRLTRDGQVTEADEATVTLFADRDEPDLIDLRGNARVGGGPGMGALRAMQARDITLDYGADGRTLERSTLAGRSTLALAGPSGGPGQQLAAEAIDVQLAPDGTVTNLAGRDAVRLTLPASAGAPARVVTAKALAGSGAPGQGVTAMAFAGGVEFREAAATPRIARAPDLRLALMPVTGELQDARFTGGFRFDEGTLRASSAEGAYQLAKGQLLLSGRQDRARPRVADTRMAVDGERILLALSPQRIDAEGGVTTVLQPGSGGVASRTPSLLAPDQAINLTAERLSFDGAAGRGTYTGGSRLFQGQTSIVAETIVLDEERGDLSASGKVTSTLALADAAAPKGPPPPLTIGRAGEFRFEDATRRATYSTGAHLNGPEGDLFGDRVDLVLAKGENVLDRLEAQGQVKVTVDARQATGTRLTYHPADTRYVLTGAPVRFVQDCRETAGQTLTFYRGSDRISVDGNEETRTQSRGASAGKCTEPR